MFVFGEAVATHPITSNIDDYGSPRNRVCGKSREPRKRRIVFSIVVYRPRLPVQLVSVSMKLRQMFYTQIERRTFHTAWKAGTHTAESLDRPHAADDLCDNERLW